MPKSMFVNVTAEEENRVAIVENGVLDVFEIETLSKEHLKGNIFKVVVEGINPALEAAFVNYGGERAGFLPLDEVNFKLYPSRNGGQTAGKGRGARISRHLEKGMEVLVQVIRDAFGSKPPTMSTYYSLPGRYLVLMPGADAAGISRKIESAEQRERLRKILDELTVPPGFGVIVRTAGMETSPRELQSDLESLLELWRTIETAAEQVKPPALIFQERDLVIRTIRDYFTTDIEEVLIDDEPAYVRARKFFEAHMPDKAEVVKLYTGDKPIFTKHNVEDQIERIYKRTVQLKSGGSISIDQTEAPVRSAPPAARTPPRAPTWRPRKKSPGSCACATSAASSSSISSTWSRASTSGRWSGPSPMPCRATRRATTSRASASWA